MTPGLTPSMNPAQPMARPPKRPGLFNALSQMQPATPGAQRSTLQAQPTTQRSTMVSGGTMSLPTSQPAKPPMSGSPSPAPAPQKAPMAPQQPQTTQNNPGYLGATGQVLSQGERNLAQGQVNRADSSLDQARQPLTAAQNTYSQFEGPIQQSPFYKALYNTGVESTSSAYDAADAAMKARANAAGFGYAQPVTQGAEDQLRAQEAESLAQVPQQAIEATAPLELQAAAGSAGVGRDITGIGQTYAGIGANQGQQALGYFGAGMQGVENQANLDLQKKMALWNALASIGQDASTVGAAFA